MMELNRGDICLVNFNPAKGGEIGKLRPAVILSSKAQIEFLDTVIVVPLSIVIQKDALPYRLFLKKRDNLEQDSDACIYEVRVLSKSRIKEKLTQLSSHELSVVQESLCKIVQ